MCIRNGNKSTDATLKDQSDRKTHYIASAEFHLQSYLKDQNTCSCKKTNIEYLYAKYLVRRVSLLQGSTNANWAFYYIMVHKKSKNLKNGHFLQSRTKIDLIEIKFAKVWHINLYFWLCNPVFQKWGHTNDGFCIFNETNALLLPVIQLPCNRLFKESLWAANSWPSSASKRFLLRPPWKKNNNK